MIKTDLSKIFFKDTDRFFKKSEKKMVRDGNGYINDINDASSSIYLVISKHSTQKMVSIDTSNNDATL